MGLRTILFGNGGEFWDEGIPNFTKKQIKGLMKADYPVGKEFTWLVKAVSFLQGLEEDAQIVFPNDLKLRRFTRFERVSEKGSNPEYYILGYYPSGSTEPEKSIMIDHEARYQF